MPSAYDRRGHLVPEAEFEELQEQERQARINRFNERAGLSDVGPRARRDVILMDFADQEEEPELPDTRSHDPHTLEAARARLVDALNSRGSWLG